MESRPAVPLAAPVRPPSRRRAKYPPIRRLMRPSKNALNALVGSSALIFAGAQFMPGHAEPGPVLSAAVEFVSAKPDTASSSVNSVKSVASVTRAALAAFTGAVRPLSRAEALESAFKSYFAYKTTHPNEVTKPYLYFVDYGLPSTEPRGYVFDMESLTVVDGPFMVAHGRGSAASQYGVPTRFSNASGSNATSLGLYVAKSTYEFRGHSGGQVYSSVGLRLQGVSSGFNDNALNRGVVAHGAPYVTSSKAGRSEGCPALEPARAERLLPKLANGGMVFLFAPDDNWMSRDPWVAANVE